MLSSAAFCPNFSASSNIEEYATIGHFNHHKKEKKALSPVIRRKRRMCCNGVTQPCSIDVIKCSASSQLQRFGGELI
eukprot:14416400-Ditylum_brightwellii.AAC.1